MPKRGPTQIAPARVAQHVVILSLCGVDIHHNLGHGLIPGLVCGDEFTPHVHPQLSHELVHGPQNHQREANTCIQHAAAGLCTQLQATRRWPQALPLIIVRQSMDDQSNY
eukprot:16452359-Heterocapsa_arctica.AAC.2